MAHQGKNIRGEKEQDCLEYVRDQIFKREPYKGITAYTATDAEYEKWPFMYQTPGVTNHYYGLNQTDALQFEHLLRSAHPNPQLSEFPDFVSDRGFIEHFQVTSSEVRKNAGSIHQREESIFQKNADKADQELYAQLAQAPSYDKVVKNSLIFKYPKHSYPYFCTSFKKTWEHHLSRINSYKGHKETGIFMIEYLDSAIHMKEHFPVPDLSPETWFGDMLPRQESFHEYRLSRDKDMLQYIYQFRNLIQYVIMVTDTEPPEIIKVSSIPEINKLNPNGYAIVASPIQQEVRSTYGISIPINSGIQSDSGYRNGST